MSESLSTKTKTGTESVTESSVDDFVLLDRWTHNITYRQLIVSTSIGIIQLWWHPYVHDLSKLIPFLFLYNFFSVFIGYSIFYLELALGIITKKGVFNVWDISPMIRGIGLTMLLICAFTAMALSTVAAWCLAILVHSFHTFLPWLHCAAGVVPACSARHRPMANDSETPAESFFFNYILRLKRDGLETGMGTIVPELTIYFIMCWILIYFICIKRIYSYSKLILFKDTMAFFVVLCSAVGVSRLEGAGRMFQDADWSSLLSECQIWRDAIQYALIEMTVSQGSLIMLGVYCPQIKYPLSRTTTLAFAASKTSSIASALILGGAHGALVEDYQHEPYIKGGSSASIVLWADFVSRIPGSQVWSGIVFFTMYVLALCSSALLVQTIISSFTGKLFREVSWAILIIICLLFCLTGIISMCSQGGLYIMNFLMKWPVQMPRVLVAATIASAVTFLYGQTSFCEDVFFAVGQYPCIFLRICWAVTPPILFVTFLAGMSGAGGGPELAGWLLVLFMLAPLLFIMLLYLLFKCRVRNIVGTEK